MANSDDEQTEANLELPSLFRRKGKDKRRTSVPPIEPGEQADPEPEPEPTPEPEPAPQPEPEPAPAPVEKTSEPDPTSEDTAVIASPPAAAEEPAGRPETTQVIEPEPEPEPEPAAAPEEPRRRKEKVRKARKERRPLRLPRLPGGVAAFVTGLLCGALLVGLTWLATQGCVLIRGVGTCGGFGIFALIVILALEVWVGGLLLGAWGVPDPMSTSFLGVGTVAVLVMLFLLSSIDSVWMLVVIPAMTCVAFVLSWLVTTRIATPSEET